MKVEDIDKAVELKSELAHVDGLLKDFGWVEYYGAREITMLASGNGAPAVLRLGQAGEAFMNEMLKAIISKLTIQRQGILTQIEAL